MGKKRLITHPETKITLSINEWSKELGICANALRKRLRRYPLLTALTYGQLPKTESITHPDTGVTISKLEWAKKIGISSDVLSRRLKNHPLSVALTIGTLPKVSKTAVTHPDTGVTMSRTKWAKEIGITLNALSDRIKHHPLSIALTVGTLPAQQHLWSREEDDYLESVYRIPRLWERWNKMAKQRGWKQRSNEALSTRIYILQHRGVLDGRRHLEEAEGWLTMTQLAGCMNVSNDSVRTWMSKGLKAVRNGDCERSHYKIHLKDFVLWACTLKGSPLIAKAVSGNELAGNWLLMQIGNWLPEAVKAKKRHLEVA